LRSPRGTFRPSPTAASPRRRRCRSRSRSAARLGALAWCRPRGAGAHRVGGSDRGRRGGRAPLVADDGLRRPGGPHHALRCGRRPARRRAAGAHRAARRGRRRRARGRRHDGGGAAPRGGRDRGARGRGGGGRRRPPRGDGARRTGEHAGDRPARGGGRARRHGRADRGHAVLLQPRRRRAAAPLRRPASRGRRHPCPRVHVPRPRRERAVARAARPVGGRGAGRAEGLDRVVRAPPRVPRGRAPPPPPACLRRLGAPAPRVPARRRGWGDLRPRERARRPPPAAAGGPDRRRPGGRRRRARRAA
jgi:hypothetical protein